MQPNNPQIRQSPQQKTHRRALPANSANMSFAVHHFPPKSFENDNFLGQIVSDPFVSAVEIVKYVAVVVEQIGAKLSCANKTIPSQPSFTHAQEQGLVGHQQHPNRTWRASIDRFHQPRFLGNQYGYLQHPEWKSHMPWPLAAVLSVITRDKPNMILPIFCLGIALHSTENKLDQRWEVMTWVRYLPNCNKGCSIKPPGDCKGNCKGKSMSNRMPKKSSKTHPNVGKDSHTNKQNGCSGNRVNNFHFRSQLAHPC